MTKHQKVVENVQGKQILSTYIDNKKVTDKLRPFESIMLEIK
ncbi:putative oligo-1,6-glucosidase domain protein [Mycoplasmopsis fermentans MF-I1]|nr:hypothetical protein [Mycoplasmopsis fermentans]RMX35162.1 putative oligo-1,6-glucosidase domain protein [Mycoplasmopsis fermentans MF-I1]